MQCSMCSYYRNYSTCMCSTLCKIDILSATPKHHYATPSLGSPDLVNLVSSKIFVCRLHNLLVVLFFLFSRDVDLTFSGLCFRFIYNAARFLRFSSWSCIVERERERLTKSKKGLLFCGNLLWILLTSRVLKVVLADLVWLLFDFYIKVIFCDHRAKELEDLKYYFCKYIALFLTWFKVL